MKKKFCTVMAMAVVGTAMLLSISHASIIEIPVAADGDKVYSRYWGWFGSGNWWDVAANPNVVSHSYYPGDGQSNETALSFNLNSLAAPAENILSASFNFKILDIWTEGRNDVGNLTHVAAPVGTVNADAGTGWKTFDVTSILLNILNSNSTTADFYFSYTGYSGFTFGSAEGGNPAFLQIKTTDSNTHAPVPPSFLLLGTGIVGIWYARKNRSSPPQGVRCSS